MIDASPRTHRVSIDNWRPALTNELLGNRHKASRLKKRDRQVVAGYFRHVFRVPEATGKRRVRLRITRRGGRSPDGDAPWKSLLDALVKAGMLVDDSPRWCELAPPEFLTGPVVETVVILEEMDDGDGTSGDDGR